MKFCISLSLVLTLAGFAASASAFTLSLPVDCTLGRNCFIQQYVDRDPGPGAFDYTCGRLSYDGHKGTDIRLRNLKAMRTGVKVLAAAGGAVKSVRDGMEDRHVDEIGAKAVEGKECGNGIVVVHADGWETQYCHMKKGSVTVRPGKTIETGDVLGEVGLSGLTEFPHVQLSVRKDGQVVDPFTGLTGESGCKVKRQPLWDASLQSSLEYVPTAVLGSGFTNLIPTAPDVRDGKHDHPQMTIATPLLIFWVDTMGLLPGDRLKMTLTGPNGEVLAEHTESFETSKALMFNYIGKKRPATGLWPAGTYEGTYRILRHTHGTETEAVTISEKVRLE